MPAPVRFEGVATGELAPLDLTLRAGEALALLGAGAPALPLVLAGAKAPRAGRVLLAEADITQRPMHRRGVPLLAPEPGLLPRMTVAENIAFALKLADVPAGDHPARVQRALSWGGLEALALQRAEVLSPAEQHQVALARALAPEPAVLALAGPWAALDEAARAGLHAALKAAHHALGFTLLLGTADAREAMTLADRVGALVAGMLRQVGPPQQLYDRPADAAVAQLLGEANAFRGTVLALEDEFARIRLDCGPKVMARAVDIAAAGTACMLVLRPERVAVAPMAAEEMGEDALPAQLREITWLGDQVRLRLAFGDGAELRATRPAGLRLPRPGAPAAVAWDPAHAWAFPA